MDASMAFTPIKESIYPGGDIRKIAKEHIEVKMEIPGAILRQRTDFGDASGLGKITTTDADGKQETVNTGDLFYWPPHQHNVAGYHLP